MGEHVTDLRLTPAAMKALYASPCAIVISHSIADRLQQYIPSSMDVIILAEGGILKLKAEGAIEHASFAQFIGLPAGLIGFAVTAQHESMVQPFLEYATRQVPLCIPRIHIVKTLGRAKAFTQFINQALAERMAITAEHAAQSQHQLVVSRLAHEKTKTALNKAVRMMDGIGYGARAIVYDLPVGNDAVGMPDKSDTYSYAQELPVDLTGLSAFSLHVADAASASGKLLCVIRRASDKKPTFTTTVDYTSLKHGWYRFALAQPIVAFGGECELYLSWTGKNGPKFSGTSMRVDRFGTEGGQSLAMRIEKSITPVDDLLLGTETDLSAVDSRPLATVTASGADVFSRSQFYGGSELEAAINDRNGWPVLSADDKHGWLQTHLLADELSGIHMAGAFGPDVRSASINVHLAHAKAAPCVVFLVAAEPEIASSEETRERLKQFGASEALNAQGSEDVIAWSAAVLHAGDSAQLTLSLNDTTKKDMILIAKPLHSSKADFGWCQWNDLSISYALQDDIDVVAAPKKTGDMMRAIRAVSFPEIADRIEFYRGKYQHNKLRLSLGFMPVQMHNEFAAMQINPLKGQVCAAELLGGIPENTVRISCDVGTAHAQAARFTYILGLVSKKCEDRSSVIDSVVQEVSGGMPTGSSDDTVWNSIDLPKLHRKELSLNIPATARTGDIPFFCVIPSDGSTSFGWCRWYSLAFETSAFIAAENTL